MQGAGTAIGELPPYFMARAARLSGAEPDDEDYEEFEEMLEQAQSAQVRILSSMTVASSRGQSPLHLLQHVCSDTMRVNNVELKSSVI